MTEEADEVLLILGKRGSGKTTRLKNELRRVVRSFVLDANFHELPGTRINSVDELLSYMERWASLPHGFFRVSYTPLPQEYPLMFDVAREYGPLTLTLEEADRFPDPGKCIEYADILSRGRHYGVRLFVASLFPFALPADLRRAATRIIAFRQHEPRDIEWLRFVIGPAADELPNLPQFDYIEWTPETGSQKKGALQI